MRLRTVVQGERFYSRNDSIEYNDRFGTVKSSAGFCHIELAQLTKFAFD